MLVLTNIAVLGYGVVGSGVVEIILKNSASFKKNLGKEIHLKYILVRKEPFPDNEFTDKFICNDFDKIVNDPSVDIVVEAIGGLDPAYSYVKRSLMAGKSVVTSNKELVAEKGPELLEIAKQQNVNFLFEASVGGGIPIIKPLYQSLEINAIKSVTGILNGTTNYILSKMFKDHISFDQALEDAQALGYAESDPSSDILGYDTCRKICILSSIAYSKHIYPQEVFTEGIDKITLEDLYYADSCGASVKLIGHSQIDKEGKVEIITAPMLVRKESQLSNIDDVFNAILIQGEATGDVLFYGRGAGKMPTASSVVSDVIDIVKTDGTMHKGLWTICPGNDILNTRKHACRWFIRMGGMLNAINTVFGDNEVQLLTYKGKPVDEFAFISPPMDENTADAKLLALRAGGCKIISTIRVLDE